MRKEQFARGLEVPRILGRKVDFLGRIGLVGPTVRENLEAAAKIRKGLKEKTKEKKAAEAFKAMVDEGGGEEGEGTPPATGGATPPAGDAGGREPGEGGGSRSAASE